MLTRSEFRTIKNRTALAVDECGGQECCAAVSNRISRHASFSEYGNAALGDRVIPLDVAVELDRWQRQHGGRARFAELLCELTGHLAVPLPDAHGAGPMLDLTGKSAREIGALTEEIIAAAADGKVTCAEGQPLVKHIHDIIVLLHSLAQQVKAETIKDGGEG